LLQINTCFHARILHRLLPRNSLSSSHDLNITTMTMTNSDGTTRTLTTVKSKNQQPELQEHQPPQQRVIVARWCFLPNTMQSPPVKPDPFLGGLVFHAVGFFFFFLAAIQSKHSTSMLTGSETNTSQIMFD
jgi:hypothetical protein